MEGEISKKPHGVNAGGPELQPAGGVRLEEDQGDPERTKEGSAGCIFLCWVWSALCWSNDFRPAKVEPAWLILCYSQPTGSSDRSDLKWHLGDGLWQATPGPLFLLG